MTNGGPHPDPPGFQIKNEIDLLLGRAHPNPAREGCPPAEMLTRLARRELPIDDPAYNHLSECSPCYQEVRAIQQADAARIAAAVKRKRMAYAAAAILVLAIAGSWFALRQITNSGTSVSSAGVEQVAQLDLRPFAVTRGSERTTEPEGLVLPRARLRATILLPIGSEPGEYEVQILDGDLKSRASSIGSAAIINYVTTLETMLDTSSLPAGNYQLAVRRRGEDWRLVPAQLR